MVCDGKFFTTITERLVENKTDNKFFYDDAKIPLISGLSLAQFHASLKMSSAFDTGLSNVKSISNLFSLFIFISAPIEGMQTGFIWRSLSEAEAEAQRATYLQAVRDNQFTAQQITRLFANPVMPM
jgi:hypothetical protein